MLFLLKETFAPLLSLFIFTLGTGFFATLLAFVMSLNKAPLIAIGAMMGAYYAGFISGAFRIDRFITRVGHIRAFSAFSSSLAVICLLHGMIYNISLWLLLRFLAGFVTAGIYVVIESWLLCKSTKLNRGQMLAFYMIAFNGASAVGQFFLNAGDPQTLMLYAVTSIMCSLSIIPLSMTRVNSPQYEEPSTLNFKKLAQQAASGLLGCFSAGLIVGVMYGLMPVFLEELFHHKSDVARYMFTMILGGMILQYPIGKLSDVIERRLVLIGTSFAIILVSIAIIFVKQTYIWLFIVNMALFGGLTFALYPISIAQACDTLDNKDIVAGTQSLLLAFSVGAMIGPFLAPISIHYLGIRGIFYYYSIICLLSIPIYMLRRAKKVALPQEEPLVLLPQTSPILMEIDPRSEIEE